MTHPIEITETSIKKILTRAEQGFLRNKQGRAAVSSHSLQPYCGCTFGSSLCGAGCYVRSNFNLTKGRSWGRFLEVRTNAAESYIHQVEAERRWARKHRGRFSIFCSSSTDPFLPQETRFGITRSVLEAMIKVPPDRLILQTHTHLVTRYMDLYAMLREKCDLRFHISIETDREEMPGLPPHASPVARRLEACDELRTAGHFTVVVVAPLLPIDDPERFFRRIGEVADAVVVDHYIIGDGTSDGRRTAKTELPKAIAAVNPISLELAYRDRIVEVARRHMPGRVGVSADGFAGFYE